MTESVTSDLIYEVLKKVQHTITRMDAKLDDHSRQFIALREQLHTMDGNALRQERLIATLESRIERIESRLELHGPEQH
jgi:predicted  nucleic acid-binding Zn-ribbon protein